MIFRRSPEKSGRSRRQFLRNMYCPQLFFPKDFSKKVASKKTRSTWVNFHWQDLTMSTLNNIFILFYNGATELVSRPLQSNSIIKQTWQGKQLVNKINQQRNNPGGTGKQNNSTGQQKWTWKTDAVVLQHQMYQLLTRVENVENVVQIAPGLDIVAPEESFFFYFRKNLVNFQEN
jgi:hypothetical protein